MKTKNIPLVVAFHLAAAIPVLAQVGPGAWYFEIDADYDSVLGPLESNVSHSLPSRTITDGEAPNRHTTYAPRQGLRTDYDHLPACSSWFHQSSYSYMGAQSYRVTAQYPGRRTLGDDDEQTRRSEQMLLEDWYTGPDSTRYFTLAFRFNVINGPPQESGGYIAQWHHGHEAPPAMMLAWEYEPQTGIYYLRSGVYSDSPTDNRIYTELFRNEATPGVWHRMLFRVNPGPGQGQIGCAQCPDDNGSVTAWMMNNLTGDWEEWCDETVQFGYHYEWTPVWYESGLINYNPVRSLRVGDNLSYQWKVGHYVNETDHIILDYDNVAYGKRWNAITKNKLIGYRKSVLNLRFNEKKGAIAGDSCWDWNGGQPTDPTKDYNNDGMLSGSVGWSATGVGSPGRSLYFSGGSVQVPVDTTDFDFGNYVTVSAWFKTTANAAQPQGILCIDDDEDTGKLYLARSENRISFGVKHPDRSYSQVIYNHESGLYEDGLWHHVVGTFNRFTDDNRRVKLYIDGERVLQREGHDKPILRGDHVLTVGNLAGSSHFFGHIDEVNVLNYTMTDEEVAELTGKPEPVRVSALNVVGSDALLRFPTIQGRSYCLECTADISDPTSWKPVPGCENVEGTGSLVEVIDGTAASASIRFYRALPLQALLPGT